MSLLSQKKTTGRKAAEPGKGKRYITIAEDKDYAGTGKGNAFKVVDSLRKMGVDLETGYVESIVEELKKKENAETRAAMVRQYPSLKKVFE